MNGVSCAVGLPVISRLGLDAIQAIFGVLAFSVGLCVALVKAERRLGDQMPTGMIHALLAPLIGALSVLMGNGCGSFAVPLMTLQAFPVRRAVAAAPASGFGLVIAVPSVVAFMLVQMPTDGRPPLTIGRVNIIAFAVVVATTFLGAQLAHRLDPGPLRRILRSACCRLRRI